MTSESRFVSTLSAVLMAVVLLAAGDALGQTAPVGTSSQIFSGAARWPAVAYDQVNHVYLVVVGSGGVIKGRFVAEDGTASGDTFDISSGDYAQTPRVAYGPGAGGFLVTWHGWDRIPDHGWAVRARKVTYPGGAVGAPSVLSSTNTAGEMGPSVEYAAGAGSFLVTWAGGWDIGAHLVDGNGAPVGGQIAISGATAESDRDPAVGYFPETNRFFVVWSAYNDAGHYSTARGRLLDASSGTGVGSAVQLGQSSVIYVPEVTLNASTGRMFLTWMQGYSGGFRPFGTHVDSSGNLEASPALLSSTVGTYDGNSVAYNVRTNTYFLVTQPPGQVLKQDWGFEISGAGVPLATAAAVTSIPEVEGFSGAFHPRLAPSTQEGRWLVGTVGSFTSVWTQLIGGNATQPPPPPPPGGGGGGTYSLTISPSPVGGSVSGGGLLCGSAGSTCTVTPSSATTFTISALPDSGYSFSGWSGACSGTNPTTNVSVDGVKTCNAIFSWAGNGPPPGCLAAPTSSFAAAPGPIGVSVKMFDGAVRWPDVAYDACHQVYLSVWGSGGTIRGRFVKDDGTAAGSVFDISTGKYAQVPRAAYSPDTCGFLVTWHSVEQTAPTQIAAVRAAVVTYPGGSPLAGTLLSDPAGPSSQWETGPAVAYAAGAHQFMVAWARFGEISARLVNNSGDAVGSEILLTSGAANYERDPAIAFFPGTNQFFVAWSAYNEAGAYSQGRGQMLAATTGAPVGSTILYAQASKVYVPELALNSVTGQLFVTWIQNAPGGWRPYGRFLNSDGTLPASSGSLLSSTVGAYDANSVAFNPVSKTFFLVTHGVTLQDWGFEISGAGAAAGTAVAVTSIPEVTGYTGGFNPRLASSTVQPRWLIDTAGSFNSQWTQLVGGTEPGTGTPVYQLTISPAPSGGAVSGGGLACGTSGSLCQVTFATSTTVNLTAAPASGYVFTSWGGACSGTSATTSVLVDAARTCTATFTSAGGGTTYPLSISPAPANGTVTGGGLSCGTGGSACQVTVPGATTVTLSASPGSGYALTSWGGSCSGTSPTTTVTVNAAKTCSATFTAGLPGGPPYRMTVSPKPAGGSVTAAGLNCGAAGSLCSVSMPASMPFGMQAVPAAGYKFSAWSGNCSGASPNLTIPLSGPRTCSADFTPLNGAYQLNVSPVPTGGTVTGGGLGCGTAGGACQVTYANVASITLTAAPDAGYTFTGWGGSCSGTSASTTVTVDAIKTCAATFSQGSATGPPYTLTITPPAGGRVQGAGLNCGDGGTRCSVTMPAPMTLGITSTASSGYTFTGWTGDCSGTTSSVWVQLNRPRTCGAVFTSNTAPTYRLTISPAPAGGAVTGNGLNCGVGGATCQVTFGGATTATLTATPATGYTFASWGGACSGTSTTTTVLVDNIRTCGATFTSTSGPPTGPPYTLTITQPTGGKVTAAGLNCGAGGTRCSVTMPAPMTLGISATPSTGYTFTGWTGDCSGTVPGVWIALNGPRTCAAIFTPTGGGGSVP